MNGTGWTSLGSRIKKRRVSLGLTQSQLAGKQFTKSFVSQIETGKALPSLDTLDLIASRLGCTVSDLLQGLSWTEKARTYIALCETHILLGNYRTSRQAALNCLRTGRRPDGRPNGHLEIALTAHLWLVVGICHIKDDKPNPGACLRCMERARKYAEPAGETWIIAASWLWSGTAYNLINLPLRALKAYEACLRYLEPSPSFDGERATAGQRDHRAPVLQNMCREQLAQLYEQFNDRELARSIRSSGNPKPAAALNPEDRAKELLSQAASLLKHGEARESYALAVEARAIAMTANLTQEFSEVC